MLKRFLRGGDNESLLNADRMIMLLILGLALVLGISQAAAVRANNRDQTRKANIYQIQLAVQKYYAVNGSYPVKLSGLGLNDNICADPSFGGNCASPGYDYKVFSASVKPSVSAASNCDNVKIVCQKYLLYSAHMERAANPFTLESN